jgi:tRNA(Arg) A34 adenosine deaminase TadA
MVLMNHHDYMEIALREAAQAGAAGEDPIGCVIVDLDGATIAQAHNRVNRDGDPTAHAEVLAIRSLAGKMQGEAPRGWTLYTTLEPCPMCMGMIVMAEIGTVVWAANDRRKQTHQLLSANAYMRSRRLEVIACPELDQMERSASLHDAYWISRGRPYVVQPMIEDQEQ